MFYSINSIYLRLSPVLCTSCAQQREHLLALILMSINSKDDIVEKYHRNEYKVNSNMNSMTISEHLKSVNY